MNCKHCNTELPEGAQFCGSCGASVDNTQAVELQGTEVKEQASIKRCEHCYSELSEGAYFCPNCGERVQTEGKVKASNVTHRKKSGNDFLVWLVLLVVFIVAIAGISSFTGGFNAETPDDLEYVSYRLEDGLEVFYISTFGYKDDIIYEENYTVIVNIKDWEQEWIDEWISDFDEFGKMGEGIEEFEYKKEVTDRQLKFEYIYTDLGDMNTIRKFADAGFENFEGYGLFSMSGTEENLLAAGYVLYEYE